MAKQVEFCDSMCMSLPTAVFARLARLLPPRLKGRLKWSLTIPDMEASLHNMARLGFQPQFALDIGAYVGAWTRMCRRVFPNVQIMMFEPQPQHAASLQRLCGHTHGLTLCPSILGRESRPSVPFWMLETGSSIYSTERHPDAAIAQLPMTTLDLATSGTPFARANLIKIDVQGAELEVFEGGWNVVDAAEAIIIELSFFQEYGGAPLMAQMIEILDNRGFSPYDICTIWRNTPSRAAIQADFIFVRADSPLLGRVNYVGR